MTLDMLIKCERRQSCSLRARDILQRLFDFFIHMNSDTTPYELDSAALGDRVTDVDFMAAFRCNKRPLLVLLERGFIQRTLEDEIRQGGFVEFSQPDVGAKPDMAFIVAKKPD